MANLATNLAPNPHKIKATDYYLPEVLGIIEGLGYPTRSAAVNGVFLALGRQRRQLPGVGPRDLRDFAAYLGVDATVPPEYQFTAREREHQRIQRQNSAGLPTKSQKALRAEAEAYEQEKAEFFRGELSAALGDLESIEAEQLSEVLQVEEQAPFFRGELSAALGDLEPIQPPVKYFDKAPSRKEASLCSEKLSELVTLAALYCAPALDRALDRAQGQTLEALEAELTAIVEMNRPINDTLSRRRLKRDLS